MKKQSKINAFINDFLINRLFGVRHKIVPIISFLILSILFLLSSLFLYSERQAIIQKTEDMCKSTAIGLSSVSIEAITLDKKAVINDYIKNLKSAAIEGLYKTHVIEYIRNKDKDDNISYEGEIIGSLDYNEIGKKISGGEMKNYLGLKELKLNVVQRGSRRFYVYYYPILWKITKNNKTSNYPLGVIVIEFVEREILKTFYQATTFTLSISIIAFIITSLLVVIYMFLTRRLEGTLETVKILSVTDELTKIFNRKKFNEVLHEEFHKVARYGHALSLIMFDIDHFKKINDNFGHDTGDAVLVAVVSVIKPMIRDTDLFARWGGEEFMILSPDTDKCGAVEFAERMRKKIDDHHFQKVGNLTCSFGVAALLNSDTLHDILKRVDLALYDAKRRGRNRVVLQ